MERSSVEFSPDEVGELIGLASRLDDLAERDTLDAGQVRTIAGELGISSDAIDRALRAHRRQQRSDERERTRAVRRRMRFLRHVVAYAVVVGALAIVDALGGGGWWFPPVAVIWGAIVALHGVRFATRRRGPVERWMLRRKSQSTLAASPGEGSWLSRT